LYYLASLCDKANKYDEMLLVIEKMVKKYNSLNNSERVAFEKPIKNLIHNKQTKIKKIDIIQRELLKQSKLNKLNPDKATDEMDFGEYEKGIYLFKKRMLGYSRRRTLGNCK